MGCGAAALLPSSLALISHAVPDPLARARHIAAWASSLGAGLALGGISAGVILDHAQWRWIFTPVAGIAVLILLIAVLALADSARGRPHAGLVRAGPGRDRGRRAGLRGHRGRQHQPGLRVRGRRVRGRRGSRARVHPGRAQCSLADAGPGAVPFPRLRRRRCGRHHRHVCPDRVTVRAQPLLRHRAALVRARYRLAHRRRLRRDDGSRPDSPAS